ncbi:MAG: MFS transporter [Trueperaceae bacterium]
MAAASSRPASQPDPDGTLARVRRTMRLSVVEGSAMQLFLSWTSGSVLVGYLLALGASPTHIAFVGSVPFLAQVVSPLGAWAAEVLGGRRALTATLGAIGRASWILAAFLPQLNVPDALRPTLLVELVFFASAFQAGVGTVWTAWMGDVVPDDHRGRYFGMRTGVLGAVGMLATLGAGAFLDRVAAPLSFQLVLGVAIAASFVSVVLYLFHYDPPTEKRRVSLRQIVAIPYGDRNFRRFLAFAIYWQFVVMLGAPFVIPYFLEELSMSFTQVAYWSSIAALVSLASTTIWGRAADRVGNRPVLVLGTFLAGALLPLNWILAGLTGDLRFIWISAVFDAVAWGAITPAVFNLALGSAPRSGRVAFIAMYSVVQGAAGFLGGAVSGPLITYLQGIDYPAWMGGWTGYHMLFALSGVGRMLAWPWLRKIDEPRAWRTRDVLRAAGVGVRGAARGRRR